LWGKWQKLLNGGRQAIKPPAPPLSSLADMCPAASLGKAGPRTLRVYPHRGGTGVDSPWTSMDRVDNAKAALPTLAHRLPTPAPNTLLE